MKYQATKWPVSIILDVADDYLEGIDKENLIDNPLMELAELQKMADMMAKMLIVAKGHILAEQEAKRKQSSYSSDDHRN